MKDDSWGTTVKLIRNGEEIESTYISGTVLPLNLLDGDKLEISDGDLVVYNDAMFPKAIYVEAGKYYCPDDVDSGKYTFTSLGGFNGGVAIKDPSTKNEDNEDTTVDYKYLNPGESYTFRIQEGEYIYINYAGYIEKASKLFG